MTFVNKRNTIPKTDRTIIKCDDCGFKYYEGDTHKCPSPGMIRIMKATENNTDDETKSEENNKARKLSIKTSSKNSFKIWKDSADN